jgi:hypothetical protein
MLWLHQTLQKARQANERVIVASHMPCVMSSGLHDFFCADFAKTIAAYEDLIVMMIGGHTHRDSWVTFTGLGVDLVQFVTPSLTTFSFKVAFFLFVCCFVCCCDFIIYLIMVGLYCRILGLGFSQSKTMF